MLRALSSPLSPVRADPSDAIISLSLFPRDLQKESPHCNHTITKCARSKSRMPVHLKQRRVIFPVLHEDGCSSPRSTVDCISEMPEAKKAIKTTTCNNSLTLKDIALSHSSNAAFKSSHLLPLSPLLSRDQLTRLGLDCPSRFVPALPLAPRVDTQVTKALDVTRARTEQAGNSNQGSTSLRSGRTYSLRANQTRSSSSGGRRSILPVSVSPSRVLSPSIGSDSFNSDISSIRSEQEPLEEVEPKKKYPSILRASSYTSSRKRSLEVEKVSSVESDIPSLAPSDTSDTQSPVSENGINSAVSSRDVVFDARVLVREFTRSEEEACGIWYTAAEMNAFKMEATRRILAFTRTEIIPTGTGRMIERPVTPTATKALFSHAALQADSMDLPFPALDSIRSLCPPAPRKSIQRILIVDPYDICLKLFAKAFQQAIPDAVISTARTSEEALKQVRKTTFDLIVVEERLKLFHRQQPGVCGNASASGSLLLQRIATIARNQPVLVGVSAHLPEDSMRLKGVGQVDLLWAKPPPPLSRELLLQLDGILESKRAKDSQDTNLC